MMPLARPFHAWSPGKQGLPRAHSPRRSGAASLVAVRLSRWAESVGSLAVVQVSKRRCGNVSYCFQRIFFVRLGSGQDDRRLHRGHPPFKPGRACPIPRNYCGLKISEGVRGRSIFIFCVSRAPEAAPRLRFNAPGRWSPHFYCREQLVGPAKARFAARWRA